MLDSIVNTCKSLAYTNTIYLLADNSLYLGMFFGACGVLGEIHNNEKYHPCLKTNLKVASNLILLSSILNLYRINRF